MDRIAVKDNLVQELINLGKKLDSQICEKFESNPLLEIQDSPDISNDNINDEPEFILTLGSYDIIIDWEIYEADEPEEIKYNFIYNQIEGTSPDNHTNLSLEQLLSIIEKVYTHL